MRTIGSDEQLESLEAAVARAEAQSAAELVTVLADRSSDYPRARARAALLFVLLALALLVFLPFDFAPWWILPDALLAALVGWFLAGRWRRLGHRLSRRKERQRAVEERAQLAFMEEAVSATRDRTGILFFFSVQEDRAVILPDYGIQQRLPKAHWGSLQRELTQCPGSAAECLERAIDEAAPLLAEHLPRPDDDQDEISNKPRLLFV